MNRFNSLVTRAAVVIVLFAGPGPQGCYNLADYGAVPNDGQRRRAQLPVQGKGPRISTALASATSQGAMQNEFHHRAALTRAPVAG